MPIFPLLEALPPTFRRTSPALQLRSIDHLLILPFLNGPSASEDHSLVS